MTLPSSSLLHFAQRNCPLHRWYITPSCVPQLASLFPPIHCSIVSFVPQSHSTFLFAEPLHLMSGQKLCLQRQHVAGACNGYNCAQSATSPSCVRDSCARVSLTSALSSNLWPHRLLDSLKLGTIRLIVCIKECTIEQAWSIRHYLWMDWGRGSGLILRSGYQKLEINRGGGAAIPDSRILIV